MSRPKGIPSAKTNCPHCGKELSTIRIWTHERICIHNPKVRPLIVAAMMGKHDGEGVTMSQYAARAAGDISIPDVTTLRRATGARDWAGVLAEFGLVPQPVEPKDIPSPDRPLTPAQLEERAAMADVDKWREQARAILRAERYHLYGFTVCRVNLEPGLRINGNECVRLEIR